MKLKYNSIKSTITILSVILLLKSKTFKVLEKLCFTETSSLWCLTHLYLLVIITIKCLLIIRSAQQIALHLLAISSKDLHLQVCGMGMGSGPFSVGLP